MHPNYFTALLLSTILLTNCQVNHLSRSESNNYIVDANTPAVTPDPEIQALIEPYRRELTVRMGEIIGQVGQDLEMGAPESSLGNFLADGLMQFIEKQGYEVDLVVLNRFGVRRSDLPAGPVSVGDIYELLPFDNRVAIVELPGDVVRQLIELGLTQGGWPASGTLKCEVRQGQISGISIRNKPLDAEAEYRVAMPDYVANGGDNAYFLKSFVRNDVPVFLRDAMVAHIQSLNANGTQVNGELDGRIIVINE